MFEQCSLVLTNYARPECMTHILSENLLLPWKEIVVVDVSLMRRDTMRLVVNDNPRITYIAKDLCQGQYDRMCGSIAAKSNLICTQDDDYLVSKAGWEALFQQWTGDSVCVLSPEWGNGRPKIGHGAMYDSRWMQACWALYLEGRPSMSVDRSRLAAEEAWTALWPDFSEVAASSEHVTFLLDRNWERADTSRAAMSSSCEVVINRERVRRCAETVAETLCLLCRQRGSDFRTSLKILARVDIG